MVKTRIPQHRTDLESQIHTIRGQKVILSFDLAKLYGVEPKKLVQAVKRNHERFPIDFSFQINAAEFRNLKSHTATSGLGGHGGARSLPYAFGEHGVLMAANILQSKRAVRLSVEIVRAFVRLRRFALTNEDLARKIAALETRYDGQFENVFEALRALLASPEPAHRRKIGFHQTS
ncbi:MAG: DNA-binding protein [Verrucomicrobia bacterium]|nr:DNA-binding protein [Verrucomicrobiota bacterium]